MRVVRRGGRETERNEEAKRKPYTNKKRARRRICMYLFFLLFVRTVGPLSILFPSCRPSLFFLTLQYYTKHNNHERTHIQINSFISLFSFPFLPLVYTFVCFRRSINVCFVVCPLLSPFFSSHLYSTRHSIHTPTYTHTHITSTSAASAPPQA